MRTPDRASSAILRLGHAAFRNGDPLAVQATFAISCPILDENAVPRDRFAQQLRAEYGVDIPRSLIDGATHPGDEAIREAIARNDVPNEDEFFDAVTEMRRQFARLVSDAEGADEAEGSE